MENILDLQNNTQLLENLNTTINEAIKENQKGFLENNFGKVINSAIDIALKSILPNLIENEVISVKNTILEQGISEGIKEAIDSGINFGKSAIGIATGNFDNINQIEKAVEKGGILDSISSLLDTAIGKAKKENLINSGIATMIKQGKNTVINTIKDKIGESLKDQVKSIEKLEYYCKVWNEHYQSQDFKKMDTSYKNIVKYLNDVFPIERNIQEARKIENIHNLIKNNGGNFDITIEEKQLADRLAIR